jgi:hypothetical protein
MRGKTNPHEIEYEPWNPAARGPFTALAGHRFEGTEGECALFRQVSGGVMPVPPGWLVIRLDGQEPFVSAPEHLGGPEATYSAAA